jgi:hypothetical protein
MKPCTLVTALLAVILLAGCGGSGADENKPINQVAAEAAAMGQAELQKMVDKYEAAVAGKMTEIDALKAKIKEIPLTEMMGEKATALKGDLDEITQSLTALKDRLAVYAKELQAKQ